MSLLEWSIMMAKILVVVFALVNVVPMMLWVERRGSALLQNRLGPNRVGPLGLFQAVADALKFIFKEDRIPGHVNRPYYILAPIVAVIPAFMGFAAIPFASSITLPDGTFIKFQLANLDVGLLYVLAIGSLGVYAIIIGGWASNSKYALFGSLRSSAQMISYELAMGLSVAAMVMVFSTVDLGEIAAAQAQNLHISLPFIGSIETPLPRLGIFLQPLACLIFVVCVFAETNRLPFDLAEGESEIVAGYHLEYGALRFALFFLAEYVHMTIGSAMIATFFFGGYQLLPGLTFVLNSLGLSGMAYEWTRIGFEVFSFCFKICVMMWVFVWVRWTSPRFRYDQLMSLGWKVLLPLSLANIVITALFLM